MAFGVPSFIGRHYKVFDLCRPLLSASLALSLSLPLFFVAKRSLTGIEIRGETLRDFSISSERKLEHRERGMAELGKISYISGVLACFFFFSYVTEQQF